MCLGIPSLFPRYQLTERWKHKRDSTTIQDLVDHASTLSKRGHYMKRSWVMREILSRGSKLATMLAKKASKEISL